MKKYTILAIAIVITGFAARAQEQTCQLQSAGIAFYNLENLFDTIPNNPEGKDSEFTPNGSREWNSEKYCNKIHNLAYCISEMTTSATPIGPAIIGIAEAENKSVLDDLVTDPQISAWNLQVIHHDSPDARGIDVGCLYNPQYFKPENVTNHRLRGLPFRTRDQMCIVGALLGERIAVIVNHWPSRLGGQEQSSPHREAAAALTRQIADSLWRVYPDLGIIIMGDLNDDPYNKSCAVVLGAKKSREKVGPHQFYNPWWRILEGGQGTLTYKGEWNLFDQIIISGTLIYGKEDRWHFFRANVLSMDFLCNGEGPWQGSPMRTYGGGSYLNGYSDHFPTEIMLVRVATDGSPGE